MNYLKRLSFVILGATFGAAIPWGGAQAETHTPQEQANIKLVADFYAALDERDADRKQTMRSIAERYLREDFIEHSETALDCGQGREGFVRCFARERPTPLPSQAPTREVLALTAVGDLVIRISSQSAPTSRDKDVVSPIYIFNMFRVQDGKLAEHWDGFSYGGMSTIVTEPVPHVRP